MHRVFTGRQRELELLDATPPGVVVLSGPAGCGKTALAVHWASRLADDRIVVDLHGFDGHRKPLDPGAALWLMLDALGVDPERIPVDLDARVALYRRVTAGRRLVVILDNARDAAQVRPLLSPGEAVRTVVTSRRRLTALVAEFAAEPVELDVLPEDDALELFRRCLGRARTDPAVTAAIVDACGRLPLALTLAAARVRVTGHPLETLAAELRRPAGRLDALGAAFSWSYESLSPSAARLFRLLGLVAGPDITVVAAAALTGRPEPEVRGSLDELTGVSLLAEQHPGRFTMHNLLRAYAAELAREAEPERDRRAALTRLLDHYTHSAYRADLVLNPARAPIPLPLAAPADGARPEPLDDLKSALGWLRGERDTLLQAVRQAGDEGLHSHAWQLSWALSSFLSDQQRWDDEGAAWAVALDAAARLGDGPALAYAHSFHAVADARRQRFTAAQAHLAEALELVRAAGDRAGEGECLFILSYLFWIQGEHDDALSRAEESLDLFRTIDDPMWAGKASLAVGWYLAQRGELERARPRYEEALALHERSGDDPNLAVTQGGVGWLHHQLGHHDRAAHHLGESLRLARRLGHPALEAQVIGQLGDLHESLLETAAAVAHWRRAHEILADLGHPQEAELARKLAAVSPAAEDDGLPAQLREHRLRLGLSQEDLAARSGLSVRTVRHLESGRAGRPRPETMRLLADALGLDGADRERLHRAFLA